MPNWCSTDITFYSKNKNSINKMLGKFKEIQELDIPTKENDFGAWMGDYANIFYPSLGAEVLNCRGIVTHLDETSKENSEANIFYFCIETMTAWGSKVDFWYKIITDFYPDVSMAYSAVETGCDLFEKWDITNLFYPEHYYVEGFIPKGENGEEIYPPDDKYCNSLPELEKYLHNILPFNFPTPNSSVGELEEVINSLFPEDDDYYLTINEFIDVDPAKY